MDNRETCERCKQVVYPKEGYYFQPRGTNRWIMFCRERCAKIHLDKRANPKLYTYEQLQHRLVIKAMGL